MILPPELVLSGRANVQETTSCDDVEPIWQIALLLPDIPEIVKVPRQNPLSGEFNVVQVKVPKLV